MKFRHAARFAAVFLALPLAGCLSMPHPFSDPGNTARSLAQRTPPPRLVVPVPAESLLSNQAAALWAREMAASLVEQTVPAMAQEPRPGDWVLRMTASLAGDHVIPHYAIVTPSGAERGHEDGAPTPAAAWSAGDPPAIHQAALMEGPRAAAMLTGIQAAMMQADPNSLMRRPARVYFDGVTGAPGDGDKALAQAFVTSFPDARDKLVPSRREADYTVHCEVNVTPGPAGTSGHPQEHIELIWHTIAADGSEAGAAIQPHDIDAHSLDKSWGDVAAIAAEEAAGGVRQIISNYSGRNHKPLPDDKKVASAGKAG